MFLAGMIFSAGGGGGGGMVLPCWFQPQITRIEEHILVNKQTLLQFYFLSLCNSVFSNGDGSVRSVFLQQI